MSKKKVIEEAIKEFRQKIHAGKEVDFFQGSFGVWRREETGEETVRKAREAFNKSMQRHQALPNGRYYR